MGMFGRAVEQRTHESHRQVTGVELFKVYRQRRLLLDCRRKVFLFDAGSRTEMVQDFRLGQYLENRSVAAIGIDTFAGKLD